MLGRTDGRTSNLAQAPKLASGGKAGRSTEPALLGSRDLCAPRRVRRRRAAVVEGLAGKIIFITHTKTSFGREILNPHLTIGTNLQGDSEK